jgi:hypothetical protein
LPFVDKTASSIFKAVSCVSGAFFSAKIAPLFTKTVNRRTENTTQSLMEMFKKTASDFYFPEISVCSDRILLNSDKTVS